MESSHQCLRAICSLLSYVCIVGIRFIISNVAKGFCPVNYTGEQNMKVESMQVWKVSVSCDVVTTSEPLVHLRVTQSR